MDARAVKGSSVEEHIEKVPPDSREPVITVSRVERLLSVIPIVLYRIDAKGGNYTAKWVSANIEPLLGYTAAESLAPGWWASRIHPEDRAEVFAAQANVIRDGKMLNTYRFRHGAGHYVWVQDEMRVIDKRDDGTIEIIGSWTDVTESREREQQDRDAYLRSLLERGSDIVTILDETGNIAYESPSVESVLGHRPEDMVGRSAFEFVHPDDVAYVVSMFQRVLQDPAAPLRLEFRFRHASGHWPWLEATGRNLLHDPTVRGIVVNSRDVSDEKRLVAELSLAYDLTLEGWSRAVDLRDKETEGHTRRVTDLTVQFARAVGIAEEEIVHIRRGSLLHDIGKLGVPDSILLKAGPLDESEWVVMRRHPEYAYEWLSRIPFLHPALDIPYAHHEKWDGSGYPRGLRAEDIPLAARLFAIVDVWDAMRSDRPYRKGWEPTRVIEHIRGLAGSHFDPSYVPVFLDMVGGR